VTVTCANGHESGSDDYCDQCGIRLGGAAPQQAPEQGLDTLTRPKEDVPVTCPVCGDLAESGGRYCESCGTDLEDRSAFPMAGNRPAPEESLAPAFGWQLLVSCDRGYFDKVEAEGIEYPAAPVDRTFLLTEDRIAIGREGTFQPGEQVVDLSEPPADSGISRRHALLVRHPDGSWRLIDRDSTNGTYLNDGSEPIPGQQPVVVGDGDQIHVGAWTTITLRLVQSRPRVPPPQAVSSSGGPW
jgi:FHA domain/Double zinc ribbon